MGDEYDEVGNMAVLIVGKAGHVHADIESLLYEDQWLPLLAWTRAQLTYISGEVPARKEIVAELSVTIRRVVSRTLEDYSR